MLCAIAYYIFTTTVQSKTNQHFCFYKTRKKNVFFNNKHLEINFQKRPKLLLSGSAIAIFLLYLLYFVTILQFNMFRSDVLQYWKMSFQWNTPFNVWWAPGYSLLIALLRAITFNIIPPMALMIGISLTAFLISILSVYRIANENKYHYPGFISLVFVFFPFVGLNFAVFPMADISSIALYLCAIYNLKKSRLIYFIVFSAIALLFHKIMWFFIPPLTIWGLFIF